MSVDERLRQLIAEILDEDPAVFHDDFGPGNASRWTSLNAFRMVTAIEEAFSISFTMGEIEGMTDFGKIKALIASKCGA